ncbi:MAG TPA: aminotransferase class I/II-fold pyridoxal phosphate-dependent enzyme [Chloroflexia bacterium]|nr:aminotransferase class I/II-fold pyridoxal phosphate-dependent enzyme [Chloroflexia bacterium]
MIANQPADIAREQDEPSTPVIQNPKSKIQNLETVAVHAGERVPVEGVRPTSTPIYASSAFLSDSAQALEEVFAGTRKSYVYTRYANPTVVALEMAINALEGGAATAAFGSGMAALHAALLLVEMAPGEVILAARDLYGASHTLLNTLFAPNGITPRFVDCNNLESYAAALQEAPRPRAVLVEPLSNPLIRVLDMEAIIRLAHDAGALVIVDNTFATPFLLQPIARGADIVVHSATKYFGGHGDASAGSVTVRDPAHEAPLRNLSKLMGAVLSPWDAHLIHRGLKTLALRLERHCANALAVATWLSTQPRVAQVHYPGLPAHPGHALAGRLFRPGAYGGMLAFEIAGADRAAMFAFIDRLQLLIPATTLGDVYSEVSYPIMSSHRDWAPALRRRAGITDGLLRLSAGIEHAQDIIADLEQALAGAGA